MKQISTPKKSPRPRKKYAKVADKLFEVGDCISLEADGQVHCGVVCKILEYRGQCEYCILVMEDLPNVNVESFQAGNYYGRHIPSWGGGYSYGPHVIRPKHRMLVRIGNPFAIVGHVELDTDKITVGSFGRVVEMGHVIADFVRTKKNSAAFRLELLPLSELLKR